jgi:predicted PurR-regulated permease PerM
MSINQLIGSVYAGKDIENVVAPFDKLASNEPVASSDESAKSMPKIKVRTIGWFTPFAAFAMYVLSIVTMFLSLNGLTYRNHDNKTGSYGEEEGKKQADTLFAVLFIAAHFGALIALYAYVAHNPSLTAVGIVYFCMSIVPMIITISVIAAQMNDSRQ